jgi:hypothetical protein
MAKKRSLGVPGADLSGQLSRGNPTRIQIKHEQQPCWKSPELVDTWNVRPVATTFWNWSPTLQQQSS